MPVITVYVGRLDFGPCSGMIYSFEPIATKAEVNIDAVKGFIQAVTTIRIQTPDGYVLEQVKDPNPYGDTGSTPMVYDPVESAKGTSGRVYMRAARLVERMRSGFGYFALVG